MGLALFSEVQPASQKNSDLVWISFLSHCKFTFIYFHDYSSNSAILEIDGKPGTTLKACQAQYAHIPKAITEKIGWKRWLSMNSRTGQMLCKSWLNMLAIPPVTVRSTMSHLLLQDFTTEWLHLLLGLTRYSTLLVTGQEILGCLWTFCTHWHWVENPINRHTVPIFQSLNLLSLHIQGTIHIRNDFW